MTSDSSGEARPPLSDVERIRRLCRKSLKFLSKELLGVKDWSTVHDDLSKFLRKPSKRKLILIPRNHLKSTVITKCSSIQHVLNNPDSRILIANATWDNAKNFMGSIRKLLTHGSHLPAYFGRFDSDTWNADALVVRQRKSILDSPTWASAGIDKELTSQHYDRIIADDLVAPKNSETAGQREKVFEYYLSLFDLLDPEGEIIVVGTRYHQDDLYARILEENESMHNWDVFIRAAYNDDGSILFPEKFTEAQLNEIRSRPRGAYHFASQYLNNPIDPAAAEFKQNQIRFYEPSPPPTSLYLTIDPAVSLSKDADYSAGIVAGMYADRRIRVVDSFHRRCVPSELIDEIFAMVKKWRLHRVGIETFGFQKTLKYEIQRRQRETGDFFSVDELGKRHTGREEAPQSKAARIRRLQPYFEQGLVEIRRDMSELVTEILSFPRGKHDDLVDALAYQLDYLVPSMGKSSEEKNPDYRQDEDGRFKPTGSFWNKQLKDPEGSVYDRFFSDMKS
jgi:predicted phage terminase large subunit-like protein